jgi:uncharacterized damage-inducible protein DinB
LNKKLTHKQGRPRQYSLEAPSGFADNSVGLASAALDELRARVIDQIEDLPHDALSFVAPGTPLTIAALMLHLIWAEAGWIERITPAQAPADLRGAVQAAGRAVPAGEAVQCTLDAADLVTLCHRVRDELTVPALAKLSDIDRPVASDSQPMTPRAVLMHLVWHWTYHSAHIGLIRQQWGSDYSWTFGAMA